MIPPARARPGTGCGEPKRELAQRGQLRYN
jgi:hypothetical protein